MLMLSVNAEKSTASQVELVDTKLYQQVQTTVAEAGKALLGKDHQMRLALCCLFPTSIYLYKTFLAWARPLCLMR